MLDTRDKEKGSSQTYARKSEIITPPSTCNLGVTECKKQLNVLFSDYLLDPDFYNQAKCRGQTLIVAGVKDFPLEITNGIRMDQQDIDTLHEEADMIIVK